MKRLSLSMLVAVALVVVGGQTAAARETFPTDVSVIGVLPGDGGFVFIAGIIESPKAKCLGGRTVKAIAKFANGSKVLVDVDQTSAAGAWAVIGNFGGADQAKIKVTKSKIGRRGHRKTCNAGSANVD